MKKFIRVHFEDHGQDFLNMVIGGDINQPKIIDCGPFQRQFWVGLHVLNLKELKVGRQLVFVKDIADYPKAINYPIKKIEKLEHYADYFGELQTD